MKDPSRTNQELLKEISFLKQRIKELEQSKTEHIRVEEKLRESEEKFTIAFMKSAIPMAITTIREGRYTDVNEAFSKVMGLKREDLIGNTSTGAGYITPEQRTLFLNELNKKGYVENLELQMKIKGGEVRYGLFNSTKIRIANEDYLLTMVTDITVKKWMEKTLRESEERYRSIFENAIEGMYQASPEGRYLSVNPALARMHGFESPQEMITAVTDIGSQIFISPEVRQRYREILEKEDAVVNFEFELYRKDRSKIWVSTSARVVRNKDGETVYYEGKVEDITKRKQAQEALKKSEERFRALVETTNDWVWETDGNAIYTYVSSKVKDLLGYEPEEVVGKRPFDFMPKHEAERLSGFFRNIAESHQPFSGLQNVNLHKDGWEVALETNGVPIVDAQGNLLGYHGIDRDITERRRAQDEREKLVRELQEAVNKIKTLSGLLPICASCKKIKNNKGQWEQMEVYIRDHSEAKFSHGICPVCSEKLYPEYFKKGE